MVKPKVLEKIVSLLKIKKLYESNEVIPQISNSHSSNLLKELNIIYQIRSHYRIKRNKQAHNLAT